MSPLVADDAHPSWGRSAGGEEQSQRWRRQEDLIPVRNVQGRSARAKVPTARGRTGRDPRASPLPAPRSSALTGGIRGRYRLYGLRPAMPPVNACAADARRDDQASAIPRTQRVWMSHTQRGEPAEAGCAGSAHPGPLRSLAEYGDASAHAASVRIYRQ